MITDDQLQDTEKYCEEYHTGYTNPCLNQNGILIAIAQRLTEINCNIAKLAEAVEIGNEIMERGIGICLTTTTGE